MKEYQKIKLRRKVRRIFVFFLMYALLPLICGGVAGLLIFVNSIGEKEAEGVFQSVGKMGLSTVAGAESRAPASKIGFYFLSPELGKEVFQGMGASLGAARYFSPLLEKGEEESRVPSILPSKPEEEKSPLILYDALPEDAVPVVSADLSSPSYFINSTKYTVDVEEVRGESYPVTPSREDGPVVLVLHTHGTEGYLEDDTNLSSFAPEGVETYFSESTTSFRTNDPEKSVVRVGKVFCETLEEKGIKTLHCTVMHDEEDFNAAYEKSAETVKRLLEEYPSIQYVIDLHRDSVVRGESYVKSYAEIDGEASAQVMLVVGTNQNGRHPEWRENLKVGVTWKDRMDDLFPSLSRSLYLRTARFNQEFLPGCLLLEVGSCANTLEEAELAAKYAALAFSEMLEENE